MKRFLSQLRSRHGLRLGDGVRSLSWDLTNKLTVGGEYATLDNSQSRLTGYTNWHFGVPSKKKYHISSVEECGGTSTCGQVTTKFLVHMDFLDVF